ncbi:hypothetical protein LMG33818_000083 [Halomonadaceae bacterium LMG 33818]|uniref:DUF2797 domain-containing protein n=1 Tax=Cernens ardua TaxID=3402176 RepID=UPI003EDCAB81
MQITGSGRKLDIAQALDMDGMSPGGSNCPNEALPLDYLPWGTSGHDTSDDGELFGKKSIPKEAVKNTLSRVAEYHLRLDDARIPLNPLLGKRISLRYLGDIHCVSCGRKTKKSFQGHCWVCFTSLARCDRCIMSPELCHFEQGTCREPEWGLKHCFSPHIVYLAASASVKVGITKPSQMPVRWLDQGAVRALPIFDVASRQQSGIIEDLLRQKISDRTPWQRMLKGQTSEADLQVEANQLVEIFASEIAQIQQQFGLEAIQRRRDSVRYFHYPVLESPKKIVSLNLEKQPHIEGTLMGMRGQYLILDVGVLNIRRFEGYQLAFACDDE